MDTYPYVGVLLDRHLSFQGHLPQLLSRGWDTFNSFLGAADSTGLPVPMQAESIPLRIEAVALYGIEFCIGLSGAESALNRMQAGWAKALLGCRDAVDGRWAFLICECGWQFRLGTRMFERAVMLKARLQLLPASHPTSQLLSLAVPRL